MWRHWKDVWTVWGLVVASIAVIFLTCVIYDGLKPNERIGYHIRREGGVNGAPVYYAVISVVRHSTNRTIFTSPDIYEAMGIMEALKQAREAE